MNLKVPGAVLPLGCAILSTRAKTVRGVGTTPLRRTSVKILHKWVSYICGEKHGQQLATYTAVHSITNLTFIVLQKMEMRTACNFFF